MPKAQRQAGKYFVAGLFLADDNVIVRVADAANFDRDGLAYDQMLPRRTEKATGRIGRDLTLGFRLIGSAMPESGILKGICIAIPGPIQGSGTVSTDDADILTTEFHRRGPKWQKVDLKTEIRRAIKAAGNPERISPDVPFCVLPDAAAYALGEYMIAQHTLMVDVTDKDIARSYFRETTVYAHLTIDEGIAGAIVSRGHLVHSRFHAEIGHLPLRRYEHHGRHDTIAMNPRCKAHEFKGCAEAYVSLHALRTRWPNVEHDLPRWRPTNDNLQLIAYYIMQLCNVLVLIEAPSRIYLSGRVVRNPGLVELINLYLREFLTIPNTRALYPGYPEQGAGDFVRRRTQGDSGVYGCLIEAERRAVIDQKVVRIHAAR